LQKSVWEENMTISADGSQSAEALDTLRVSKVPFDAPWKWLDLGWRDLWAAPSASLTFGAIAAAGAFLIAAALVEFGALPLFLPLAGGFLIIGPLLAVGLYEVSRRRELGQAVALRDSLRAAYQSLGRLALFGVLLLIIFFAWVRIAFLLFMLFFGTSALPPLPEFVPALLFTPHGLGLLVTGTAVGAALAVLTFAISAVSVPLMFDRSIDPVTASVISVQAVLLNPRALALWAALIAAAAVLGFVTFFLGLSVTFPLAGHATWHAYRDLLSHRYQAGYEDLSKSV
jgi:uncharacterized membrane protein